MTFTNILSAIVMFFKNLFCTDTRTEAQKVHDIINNEICMVTNVVVLDKLNSVVDYVSSQNDTISAKQIINVLLEFISIGQERLEQRYTARCESYKQGLLTRHLVTIVDHKTKDIKKYRTYQKKNVSTKYIHDKYGIFVLSVDKPKIEMQVIPFKPRRLQKKRYSRNCICAS